MVIFLDGFSNQVVWSVVASRHFWLLIDNRNFVAVLPLQFPSLLQYLLHAIKYSTSSESHDHAPALAMDVVLYCVKQPLASIKLHICIFSHLRFSDDVEMLVVSLLKI